MLDWKKEFSDTHNKSENNFCGWCIGSPPSANCDGGCFKEGGDDYVKNRYKYLKNVIPKAEQRLADLKEEFEKEEYNTFKIEDSKNEYEYEMLFTSEDNEFVKIDGWYPIATNRIKDMSKIDEYIAKGLIRKIEK